MMLAAQAAEVGCETRTTGIVTDDPELIAAAVREAATDADLVILIAGSSAGRDDYTARVVATVGSLAVHGVAVRPGHPVVLGTVAGDPATPILGAPGYPVSAALTFDIFAAPMLAALEGAAPRERPATTARLARKLASAHRLGRLGTGTAGAGRRRRRGHAAAACGGRADLARPRRRPAGRAGRGGGPPRRRAGAGGAAARARRHRAHDRRDRLARPRPRRRRLGRCARPTRCITLASSNVGSLGGLVALRDGLCHLAGSHLLDPATGEYTLPYLDRIFGSDSELAVVRLVHRDQGLLVAPGNPLGLTGLADLTRPELRYVNRQRGAGTRVLLDHALGGLGVDPTAIGGYSREEHTHLGVAAAVAAGRADTGLGIQAAARAFGLDFVPVAREPYDLVLRADRAG